MPEQAPHPEQFPLTEADHFAPDGVTPRIDDPGKAEFMARSNAKRWEEAAAHKRSGLVDLVYGNNEIDDVDDSEGYGKIKYTNRDFKEVGSKGGNVWPGETNISGINGPVETINYYNKKADRTYDAASLVYDAIKKTKR